MSFNCSKTENLSDEKRKRVNMEEKKAAKTHAQRQKEYKERNLEDVRKRQREWYHQNKDQVARERALERARQKIFRELFHGVETEKLHKAAEVYFLYEQGKLMPVQ